MTSTFTPNLALEIPSHGDYAATGWDNPMDNSLRTLDTAYGGYLSLAVTGGTTQLTLAQASNPVIILTGTLTADQYIYFPPIAGYRVIIPSVTLGGHMLYIRGNNGADTNGVYFWTGFGIPYPILVTPNRVYWDYGGIQPGLVANMPIGFAGNGWLPCDGRTVNMGLHDLLWYTIGATWGSSGSFPTGSFVLPDYRGTVTAMADQIGTVPSAGPLAVNRGNRGILNSWGLATYGGEANHTLSGAEMPSHAHGLSDPGHAHSVADPGHAHGGVVTGLGVGPNMSPASGWQLNMGNTAAAGTGIGIYAAGTGISIGAAGGSGAHNNVQPTTTVMKMIRW